MAATIETNTNSTGDGNGDSGSPWPEVRYAAVTFLLDASDDFEAELLRDWVERLKPASDPGPRYSFVTLAEEGRNAYLAATLEDSDDTWMQPLRIAWLPPSGADANRSVFDSIFGRIAASGPIGRRWLAQKQPERLACVAGDGANLSDLRDRHSGNNGSAEPQGELADFIASQAIIALERSERTIRGARYKIPRIIPGDVFANVRFQHTLANVAQQRDRPVSEAREKAARYLREMAARLTPFTLDIMTSVYRTAIKSHHDAEVGVDEKQLATVAQTLTSRPVVFLISHKSMLDTAALSQVLFDANLPLPLTFGGINLRTPGIGALARRSGIIFLRRSFQDNEIYKATFRRYIDYLIEKRFSLLWALEGTRSRTGKLLPPRFGLFNYVVESILRTKLYDVTFVPVSVAYDQITEVEDYAIEQRGRKKKAEGLAWVARFLKRGRSRGKIHLRFGKSLTITDIIDKTELDAGIDNQKKQILVPTLAFEVAVRMNAATPVTSVAIVTLILLAGGNRAMSLRQIQALARPGAALIRHRELEIVGHSDFDDLDAVRATLDELHQTGIVDYLDDESDRLYVISPDQHLNAAYYRNTAIHYFVLDAFVEIALLSVASDSDADSDDHVETFFRTAEALRELFKFEFYFPRRAQYRAEIDRRASDRFGDWESITRGNDVDIQSSLREIQPLVAHAVLRSFVDAYRVAAKVLTTKGADALDDEAGFLAQCLKIGKKQLLQGRVFSAESVSKTLYSTGLQLARYRGLLSADKAEERQGLHHELSDINHRLDEVLAISLAHSKKL